MNTSFARVAAILWVLSGCTASSIEPQPGPAAMPEPRDYGQLLIAFDATVTAALFDPRILNTAPWATFRAEFGRRAVAATDDETFKAAFDDAYRMAAPFSHFDLWFSNAPPSSTDPVAVPAEAGRYAWFRPTTRQLGVLRIATFQHADAADQIEAAFDEAITSGVSALAVDLRGNPGGSIAAWPVLTRLIDAPQPIGYLVSNKWFATHNALPSATELATQTPLTEPDLARLQSDLLEDGLLVMAAVPAKNRYQGDVFVLIDERTKSTSEVVAGILRFHGRAILVGEKSGGEVLNADVLPLGDGVKLLLPLADYLLPDGRRLEGVGLVPDLAASDALDCVGRVIQGADAC